MKRKKNKCHGGGVRSPSNVQNMVSGALMISQKVLLRTIQFYGYPFFRFNSSTPRGILKFTSFKRKIL